VRQVVLLVYVVLLSACGNTPQPHPVVTTPIVTSTTPDLLAEDFTHLDVDGAKIDNDLAITQGDIAARVNNECLNGDLSIWYDVTSGVYVDAVHLKQDLLVFMRDARKLHRYTPAVALQINKIIDLTNTTTAAAYSMASMHGTYGCIVSWRQVPLPPKIIRIAG